MKKSVQSLTQHHRFVHYMRILLMGLAGIVFILLLTWPQLMKRADLFTSMMKEKIDPKTLQAKIDMTKVQFVSEDEKGQPFVVTSEYIIEIDSANKLVQLDKPQGEITLTSGVKLICNSPLALFAQDTQVVHFTQGVHVISDNGYKADMFDVLVDHNRQIAQSNNVLKVRGEKIDLDSFGFVARKNGEEIDFSGPVRMELKGTRRLIITAKKVMEARQKTQTITAIENVVIDDGTNKVYGKMMTASFAQIGKNQYEIRSVHMQNNVRVQTPNEEITGDEVFYDVLKEQATIEGNITIKRKQGVVQGQKAFVDMKNGTSQLQGAVNQDKRVKGTLMPSAIKKKEK